jgi:hypothetical protein
MASGSRLLRKHQRCPPSRATLLQILLLFLAISCLYRLVVDSSKEDLGCCFGELIVASIKTNNGDTTTGKSNSTMETSTKALLPMGSMTTTEAHRLNNDLETSAHPAIPHRMIVVDTRFTSIDQFPEPHLSNVKNTIEVYRKHWGGSLDVVFVGGEACEEAIAQANFRLLKYYYIEKQGPYKSDLCRYAILFLNGGYYFDNDMIAVKPVQVPPTTTFVSPLQLGGGKGALFNSFIAVTPRHPIMNRTFEYALRYYQRQVKYGIMGTEVLFHAHKSTVQDVGQEVARTFDTSLAEIYLTEEKHPDFPRLDGVGCCCDVVVHNQTTGEIYFYSHLVGPMGAFTCGAKRQRRNKKRIHLA